jgi:hypothetical protein
MLRSLDDVPGRMHSTPCAGHELEPERTPAVWLGRGAGRAYHRPGQRLPASVPIAPVFQRKRAHGWSSPVRPPWTSSARVDRRSAHARFRQRLRECERRRSSRLPVVQPRRLALEGRDARSPGESSSALADRCNDGECWLAWNERVLRVHVVASPNCVQASGRRDGLVRARRVVSMEARPTASADWRRCSTGRRRSSTRTRTGTRSHRSPGPCSRQGNSRARTPTRGC